MTTPVRSVLSARRRAAALLLALAVVGACSADAGVGQGPSEPADIADPSPVTGDAGDADVDSGGEDAAGDGASGDADSDGGDDADGDGAPGDAGDDGGGDAGDAAPASGDQPPPFDPAPLEWEDFRPGVEVATLDVPVDYHDPDGPTLELFVARRPADDPDRRIGSLLVNPGGPGFGGSVFAVFGDQVYDDEILTHFDIVGWDPRGTGESDPAIDCIEDWDDYIAALDTSDDPEADNIALAQRFAEACEQRNPEILAHVGTNNSARDMDALRRALGEDTISYFGFSYGSELGATWATLFPDTVRAAVLDGAADPEADQLEAALQQFAGFEATLTTFLAQCSDDPSCEFHSGGDAEGAFDELMEQLEDDPIPSRPDRPDVGRGVATIAVVQAMYSDEFWPQLERALAAAAEGDGSGLLALYDSYYQRQGDGTYGDELEAFQVISCADTPERPTPEEAAAEVPLYHEVAPRLVPEDSEPSFFCSFFPPAVDPRVEITGAGAGPIVVIGTTGDPATPLSSTEAMAEALEDGRLVVVEADQHTGYGVNDCVVDVVNAYLVDLDAPADGTECR